MCEPVETTQSFGDDVHAVATQPVWARERGLHTVRRPLCRWVVKTEHLTVRTTDAQFLVLWHT